MVAVPPLESSAGCTKQPQKQVFGARNTLSAAHMKIGKKNLHL